MKGENSIKLFGDDLEALTKTANQIKTCWRAYVGSPILQFLLRLVSPPCRLMSIVPEPANTNSHPVISIQPSVVPLEGNSASNTICRAQHTLVSAHAPRYRQSPEAIRDMPTSLGEKGPVEIPLSEVATVDLVSGAAYIYREQQQRYLPIKFSVRDRDLGSAIAEAQRKDRAASCAAAGSRLEWVGEFGNLQEAIGRLRVVVPVTLGLIALLLWINFGSLIDTLLTMSVIPSAVIGGRASIRDPKLIPTATKNRF